MKQRLLLCLLMLMVSVGVSWAAIEITVPAGGTLKIEIADGSSVPNQEPSISLNGTSTPIWNGQGSYDVSESDTEQKVSINGVFKTLKLTGKATTLTIDKSELVTLTASNLGLTSLKFSNAPALKTVDVSENGELAAINGSTLAAIETFNASNCALASFPTAAENAGTLKSLNLSGNKLTGDGLGFSSYSVLENLDLSNNQLSGLTVPATLETLNISNNNILGVQGLGTNTAVTVGRQKCTVTKEAVANRGLNLEDLNIRFNSPTLVWNNVSATWERQKSGSSYEANTNHGHKRSGNTAPSMFYFYDTNKENIYQDGNYRVTLTCTDAPGASIEISGIKIKPAEFKLEILDPAHITVKKGGTPVNNGDKVTQGEILEATYKNEGHELSSFEVKSLDVAEGSSLTKNPASFKVAGRWDGSNNDIAPSINATAKDALLNVTLNTNIEGDSNNSIKVVAQKGNNEPIVLQEGKNTNIPYQSKITITFKVNVGDKPTLSIGGKTITIDETYLVKGSNNTYEYVIEQLVKDNETITANIVADQAVDIKLNLEGAITNISSGAFAPSSQVWIGTQTYSVNDKMNHGGFTPGSKVQVYFYLTRAAVDGSDPFDTPIEVEENIIYDGKSYPIEKVQEFKEASEDKYDGIYKYTATIEVSPVDATLTIRTKELDKVTINPIKGSATTNITEQRHVYDGKEHPFEYTTNPTGYHGDVKVAYKAGNAAEYGEDAPINAGTYTVKCWMEQTTEHCDVKPEEVGEWKIIIEPASVEITTEPKVDVQDGKYVITGGTAKANGQDVTKLGHFRVVKANGYDIDEESQEISLTTAHTVVVRFTVEDAESRADDPNYKTAEVSTTATIDGQGTVTKYGVKAENIPSDITLTMYNGDKEISDNTEVPTGTEMKIILQIPENYNPNTNVALYKSVNGGTLEQIICQSIVWSTRQFTFTTTIDGPTVFTVKANADFTINKEYVITMLDNTVTYNGKEQDYPLDKITVVGEDNQEILISSLNPQFAYALVDGNMEYEVGKPKNAGTYKVYLTIPYQGSGAYKEYKAGYAEAKMIINKVPTVVTEQPKPTLLPKGQTLKQSNLVGGVVKAADVDGNPMDVTIAGEFDWANENIVPKEDESYDIVFTPDSEWAVNYEAPTGMKMKVTISDKNLITIEDPGASVGRISVWNDVTGEPFSTGDIITEGTRIHIIATPTSDFDFNYISVNGQQFTTPEVIYTVNKDESVAIFANFSIIEPEAPDPEIDPNTQYIVTLPGANDVRGAIINNPGKNGVKFNQPFSFSISTLAADAKNLVVKANGVTLTPTSAGTYRLASVTGNTTVTVSLANPTELKVNIPREYKNAKDYLVGKVQVEGPADGKCYYGDQITLVAYPESGVSFTRWSDGNREQLREMTVTKDLTLKAEFSGTPTGIEDIESAGIYAGNGYIQVKNVANADLTVVSISGRIQTRQHLDGDVQVRVPAGVYVVVLESGKDVKRVKVIVR